MRQALDQRTFPPWLMGRHRELYSPLLVMANLADEGFGLLTRSVLSVAESELDDRGKLSREAEIVIDFLREK